MGSDVAVTVETGAGRNGERQLRRHFTVGEPRAAVLLVHGMGEHSGRYLHVGQFLAERGFDVLAFDNQGFGRSGGRRGHIDRFDTYVDNIEDLLAERTDLGVPVVLFGHSLGGLMSTRYLTSSRSQPDLAVLSAPALGAVVPRWQRIVAPILGRLAPKLFVPAKPIPGLLSRDPAVDESYDNDPIVVRGATAGMGHQVFTTMADTAQRIGDITVPTYVFHGDDDRLVPPTFTRPLANVDTVTYRTWPGLRHEALNEPEWAEVLTEVCTWLDDNL